MSVNMDMDEDGPIDYSSFKYQQIVAQHDDGTGGAQSKSVSSVKHSFSPLGPVGGLEQNEVAELVYAEVSAHIEYEDSNNDQNVASSTEFRGVLGANLPAAESAIPADSGVDSTADVVETAAGTSASDISGNGYSTGRDEIFQLFRVDSGPPFDDQTNGPGGTGGRDHYYAEKNWRALTGRGPVLDSSDDVDVVSRITSEDVIIPFTGSVRCHLVWDVAEVSDAGRAFSVPR